MSKIYKTPEGQKLVEERYRLFLKYWPAPNQQRHVSTSQGDTFVISSGDETSPPLVLLHGSAANSASWMGDVGHWAKQFRVHAIDVIGEPGLSAPTRPAMHSDAFAHWLDDVLDALDIQQASLVGTSLGGWIALDYAVRRPQRARSLVVISPSGIGRRRAGILFKIAFYKLCGEWGTRKLREAILGRPAGEVSLAAKKFGEFVELIHRNFRPRREKIPIFSDDALFKLQMPILAIVGDKDVLIDQAETKTRLQKASALAEVRYLEGTGHLVLGQTAAVSEFVERSLTRYEPAYR
jgi:pimeloyl-ACP methyl ester carboxylesterase